MKTQENNKTCVGQTRPTPWGITLRDHYEMEKYKITTKKNYNL